MRLMLILALVCAPVLLAQADPLVKPAPKAGQADIRDGEDAFEDGRMQDAVDHFTKAIAAQPANDEIYAYRAAAYVALEKTAEAETDLAEAMKLETTFSLAFNTRGYVRWLKRDLPGAIEDYTAAIAYAADDRRVDAGGRAQMYQNRGIAYQDAGNTDRALLDFNSCIQLAPSYPAFYENRGLIYVDKQLFDIAFKDFDTALELDPKSARGYVNRAWAARLMGDYEQSVRDYSQALRIKPDYGQALIGRGYAWLGWKRVEQAVADFEAAMKLEGHAAAGETGLGDIELARNEIGAAELHYALATKLDAGNMTALYGLAKVQFMQAKFGSASVTAFTLCVQAPGQAKHWQLQADALLAESKWQAALVALNRVLELVPRDVTTLRHRLRCYAKLGLFDAAQADADGIGEADHGAAQIERARLCVMQAEPVWKKTALHLLTAAREVGKDLKPLADDPDFATLKDDPEFKKLVEKK